MERQSTRLETFCIRKPKPIIREDITFIPHQGGLFSPTYHTNLAAISSPLELWSSAFVGETSLSMVTVRCLSVTWWWSGTLAYLRVTLQTELLFNKQLLNMRKSGIEQEKKGLIRTWSEWTTQLFHPTRIIELKTTSALRRPENSKLL